MINIIYEKYQNSHIDRKQMEIIGIKHAVVYRMLFMLADPNLTFSIANGTTLSDN